MTAPTLEAVPAVAALLRATGPHRSPSGGQLTARRWGRRVVLLDVDRLGALFPDDVAEVMAPLADDLAVVAFWLRDWPTSISQFAGTGTLYAPTGAAERLLTVLWAADAGDVTAAQEVAPVVAQHAAPLRDRRPGVRRKRQLAVEAVRRIEYDLGGDR